MDRRQFSLTLSVSRALAETAMIETRDVFYISTAVKLVRPTAMRMSGHLSTLLF